ncbi:MAG: hypothetical protein NVSMB64_02630 [Candidatus Velthaea sp.]
MARFSEATWDGPVPNRTVGQMVHPVMGLVIHIEQGSEAGTDGWFHNPQSQVSAHFGVSKNGVFEQFVDTDDKAWAISSGNRYWISVENEGMPGDSLSEFQLTACGKLLAWLHVTDNVPLIKTDDPSHRGLGWHGMGGEQWGHPNCPGPSIVAQRDLVIAVAHQMLASGAPWLKVSSFADDFVAKHPILRTGSNGDAVQHARALLGIGAATAYDANMEAAVRSFQSRNALDIDGTIGPDTWSHLHPMLHQGSTGAGISELREALGLAAGDVFDAATDAAVRSRQRSFNLTADGNVGPLTYRTFFSP